MFHAKFHLNPPSNSGEEVEIYFQDGHHGHFYKSKPAQNTEGPHQVLKLSGPSVQQKLKRQNIYTWLLNGEMYRQTHEDPYGLTGASIQLTRGYSINHVQIQKISSGG